MKRLLKLNWLSISIISLFLSTFAIAQNNTNTTCAEALPVCPDNNFGLNIVSEIGDDSVAEEGPDYGCLGSQPNPLWYYMRVSQTGLAIFDLTQYTGLDQTGDELDVDFAVWGPFDDEDVCDQLTEDMLVDSSYDATGLEVIDFYNGDGCGPEPTSNPQVVNAGEVYIIVITNFSRDAGYINLIPRDEMTASFDCSILGPVYSFCDVDGNGEETVNLEDYIDSINDGNTNVGVTFHASYQGANNYTDFVDPIQTFTLAQALTVYARKEDFLTGEVEVVVISFNLIPKPDMVDATLSFCDNNGDGLELFDLTQAVVNTDDEQELTLSYYTSQEDADNGENPIEDPTYYESGNATIIVRGDAGDCYSTSTITLTVIDGVTLNAVEDSVCDTDGDGVATFNLNDYTDEILGTFQGEIRYYLNEADAIAWNDNFLTDIDAYETGSVILYAAISSDGGCESTTTLTLNVLDTPQVIDIDEPYEYCDSLNDGVEIIDLTVALNDIIDDSTGLTVSYYLTEEDALEGTNAIDDPTAFELTTSTTVYILVSLGDCSNIAEVSFTLIDGVAVNDVTLSVCFVESGEGTFDLTTANISDVGTITYYTTEEDAENGTNPISDPTNYTTELPSVVYAQVAHEGCIGVAVINLELLDEITLTPKEVSVCDIDGDGVETFDLNDYSSDILGTFQGELRFYLDEADAIAWNDNYITNTNTYTTGSVVLYAAVNTDGGCEYVTTLTINVLDAPQVVDVAEPYGFCDNYNDGVETVDLTIAFADVIADTTGFTATYYLSEEDALAGTNPIDNPSAYQLTGNTTIYISVSAGDCADVAMVVFNLTDGISVTNVSLFTCPSDDGQGTFDLTTANVSTEGNTSYYTSETDAMNQTDPIQNANTYSASVPGIVYALVATEECASIAEISLQYYDQPDLNIPAEFAICSGNSEIVDAGAGFESYVWSTGETTQSIEVDELGSYWVDVTDMNGCTYRQEFEVIAGSGPTITNIEVGQNSFTVTATGGEEPYEYSIGGFVYQDSNVFGNLYQGTYQIYVRGANGCVSEVEVASILEWPTLFTPNGDGINDTWRVPGLEIYPGSKIRIFDRYGKMVHEGLVDTNVLWDGIDEAGNKVSSQDYWYILEVSDGRKYTGHVTVKNRTEKGQ